MGGPGSTRWKDHRKASLVEDCHQLDVSAFEPALRHNQTTGVFKWTNPRGEVTAEFAFSLETVSQDGSRRLVIDSSDNRRKQSVLLERVQLGWYSGWLFRCPADCGRRSRRLYALPRWMTFCCRRCGGLTYRSTQQHDSRLDLARRDPEGFIQSRSRAPKTLKSQLVTASIAFEAQDPYRPGRGWGRTSTTSVTRAIEAMRQDYIDRWGFPPEDAGKVARGG
jgi:hypothetical protein